MSKKFTVIDTRTNSKRVWDSEATTLADLKNELRELSIETEGMVIQEGLTKTELINDESILPHDVPFRGTVTNNLVFRITESNKKISSGNDRAALYATIKEHNLENLIKDRFNKNYTLVKSSDLEAVIAEQLKIEESLEQAVKEEMPKESSENAAGQPSYTCECEELTKVKKALWNLTKAIREEIYLPSTVVEDIRSLLPDEKGENVYSDEDIDDMFENM